MRMQDRAATAAGGGTAPLGAVPSGSGFYMTGSARGRAAPAARCIAGRSRQPRSWIARARASCFAPRRRSEALRGQWLKQPFEIAPSACHCKRNASLPQTGNRRPNAHYPGALIPQRTRPERKPRDKPPNCGPKRLKNRLKNMAGYLLYLIPASGRAPLPQTAWSTLDKGIRGQALSYGNACSGMWLGLA